jgi:3,8-divinyl chlorophyllide a/chlorophyllide a reductase subunit X
MPSARRSRCPSRSSRRACGRKRRSKETQIIAIYGKGGIGKSFTLANLSYMMAQQGKKVLLIGCDPKSDTTSLLFGGRPARRSSRLSSKKKLAGEEVAIGDVCFKRDGVFAMELGGPEVGRGCGGRGIIHGFELLEKLGFHEWGFDYVLLDFLGDVVCGGFGLPIARDMCQKVIVVGSTTCSRSTSPTTSARRSSTSASSAATSASPAW